VRRSYDLTWSARDDLKEIVRRSAKVWGAQQTRAYVRKLEEATEAVVKGIGVFRDMSVLHPGLRMIHAGRHFIFCLPRQDAPALIIGFLHDRMDVLARLESRLRSPGES
jgi:toxin ParE1/3/4